VTLPDPYAQLRTVRESLAMAARPADEQLERLPGGAAEQLRHIHEDIAHLAPGLRAAGQVVVVTAERYGSTTATLTAYQREGGGWRQAFGPWAARVGTRGLAPPGEKREGDGRTPSGVYGFEFFFGVAPDPGVRFPYRQVTPRIVWDDDPISPLYNTWVDLDRQRAGPTPEPMYVSPAYDHGAVIAYNTDRTPGLGSAIFLHVSTGGPTAGCVSLPAGQLVEVLRWLDPAKAPKIVLGVSS
jgi:L,D-peptidoglycan transpeptidase YkuD (ErfK/YbiS/YcfS/YnhG family)